MFEILIKSVYINYPELKLTHRHTHTRIHIRDESICVYFPISQMDFLCPSNWIICFPQSRTVEKAREYLGMNFLGAEVI